MKIYLLFSSSIAETVFLSAHRTVESAQAAKPGEWSARGADGCWEGFTENEPGWFGRGHFYIEETELMP